VDPDAFAFPPCKTWPHHYPLLFATAISGIESGPCYIYSQIYIYIHTCVYIYAYIYIYIHSSLSLALSLFLSLCLFVSLFPSLSLALSLYKSLCIYKYVRTTFLFQTKSRTKKQILSVFCDVIWYTNFIHWFDTLIWCGVAKMSRLLKTTGRFCKRAL